MNCEYFNKCGSCNLPSNYKTQLYFKYQREHYNFSDLYNKKIDLIQSEDQHFRNRAEFKVFHKEGTISYAMNDINKKFLCIDSCPIVSLSIYEFMPKLLLVYLL